jgi:hypothetical protein
VGNRKSADCALIMLPIVLPKHGLLLELDQTDLRFTPEETLTYLERQNLASPALLQALQQRTEGWPVALQLAAITLNTKGRHRPDWLRGFSGSTDSVAEYLAQEVLDSRPARQRDFLLLSGVSPLSFLSGTTSHISAQNSPSTGGLIYSDADEIRSSRSAARPCAEPPAPWSEFAMSGGKNCGIAVCTVPMSDRSIRPRSLSPRSTWSQTQGCRAADIAGEFAA